MTATLPRTATDYELRKLTRQWLQLLEANDFNAADDFLNCRHTDGRLSTEAFVEKLHDLDPNLSIRIGAPFPNLDFEDPNEFPLSFPSDTVLRWRVGPQTTLRYPGRIADIVHALPIDGEWSETYNVSLFVCEDHDLLSLELRDLLVLPE